MEKSEVKAKALKYMREYGQLVNIYIFDKDKTYSTIKTEKKLDQDDVDDEDYDDIDIFSPATEPSNATIAEDTPVDNIVKKYKAPVKIYCLLATTTSGEAMTIAGAKTITMLGDMFTMVDEVKERGLPLEQEKWMDSYVEYTELGVTFKKEIERVEYGSRWGNEPLTMDMYFRSTAK